MQYWISTLSRGNYAPPARAHAALVKYELINTVITAPHRHLTPRELRPRAHRSSFFFPRNLSLDISVCVCVYALYIGIGNGVEHVSYLRDRGQKLAAFSGDLSQRQVRVSERRGTRVIVIVRDNSQAVDIVFWSPGG